MRELHGGDAEPRNEIVMLPLDGSKPAEVVAAGHDFYSSPRVSPDGLWLAFLCWDHPNMPWDGTELWVTPVRDPGSARPLAAGKGESVFAPAWDSHDRLRFVSDRDGWWNLYRTVADFGAPDAAEDLPPVEQLSAERADLGHPQWLFGGSTHVELDDGSLVVVRTENATEQLYALPAGGGALRDLGLPFTSFGWPVAVDARRQGGLRGELADETRRRSSSSTSPRVRSRRRAPPPTTTVEPGLLSEPRAIEFPSGDGDVAHAFYYPPTNADFVGPEGERPPLIVVSHGGPTSHATPALVARIPLLDQPRVRRRRRQLPRLEPATGAPTATNCRAPGASSTPRTASPRRASSPRPARSTASGWRSAAARRAATRRSARWSSTTSSPPGRATTASPTPRRWPATPTSSSRATSTG